jgi:hypothetical protein
MCWDQIWCLPSLLFKGYWGLLLPWAKLLEYVADHLLTSSYKSQRTLHFTTINPIQLHGLMLRLYVYLQNWSHLTAGVSADSQKDLVGKMGSASYKALQTLYFFTKFNCNKSLLSRPTNAQHIYINNILYIVNTPTCFDKPASSSASLILLLF